MRHQMLYYRGTVLGTASALFASPRAALLGSVCSPSARAMPAKAASNTAQIETAAGSHKCNIRLEGLFLSIQNVCWNTAHSQQSSCRGNICCSYT